LVLSLGQSDGWLIEVAGSCWERSADGDSEAGSRITQISEWLHECESGHPECRPEISQAASLPARLLEVPQGSSGTPIRLVQTDTFTQDDQAKQPLRYATLSYCWGNILPIRTTESTLRQFETGIPEEALPKTFRDAVRIVRALGIRYLWIDALCILQDDGDDWQRESAKMMDVYSGSVLTIAASDAGDSTGGCFQKLPSPERSPRNHGTTSIFPVKRRGPTGEMTARLQKSLPRMIQRDTHLNTRGWTFQERILSNRIAHCMDDEMHWECRHSYRTQDGHETITKPSAGSRDSRRWAGWVEDYSYRLFTHPSDRPAALYGVVRRHEWMTGHKPLLGLWDATLARDLLWMRLGNRRTPPLNGMPSWTWLAYDAWTMMDSFFRSSAAVKDDLELVHGHVSWTGEPFVSAVRDTHLRVRGPVVELRLRTTEESRRFKPPYMEVEGQILDLESPIPWPVAAKFDEEGRVAGEFEVYTCLLACSQRKQGGGLPKGGIKGFLMIERVGDGDEGVGVYRRIGVGCYMAESFLFDVAVVEVMDLV
jgi:heterokaryon incompatibility protein (HET)